MTQRLARFTPDWEVWVLTLGGVSLGGRLWWVIILTVPLLAQEYIRE